MVIASVMPGKEIEAPDAIPVETATQIVKIVAQEPGALGLAQLHLVKQYKLGELAAGPPMTQQLLFVTKGPPSPAAMAVIKATREVADKRLAKAQ